MNFITIFFTAVALAMDAFAVSITKGMTLKNLTKKMAIKIALFFGVFQAAMPFIGWLLGISFEKYIKSIDHWIALILLSVLGGKMIYEFIKEKREAKEESIADKEVSSTLEVEGDIEELSNKELTTLAVATSIDALAVGITFAFLKVNIWIAISLIGIITFIISVIGVKIGNIFGDKYEKKAEFAGGLILILLGLKILLEHLGIL